MREFIGATDSAAPCAILLDVARTLTPFLQKSSRRSTLQLVFFDGEEAFVEWTNKDSIYGARHLAQKMSKDVVIGTNITELKAIKMLVLLDLLGTTDPQIYSSFSNTDRDHGWLVAVEKRLTDLSLLQDRQHPYFRHGKVSCRLVAAMVGHGRRRGNGGVALYIGWHIQIYLSINFGVNWHMYSSSVFPSDHIFYFFLRFPWHAFLDDVVCRAHTGQWKTITSRS